MLELVAKHFTFVCLSFIPSKVRLIRSSIGRGVHSMFKALSCDCRTPSSRLVHPGAGRRQNPWDCIATQIKTGLPPKKLFGGVYLQDSMYFEYIQFEFATKGR